MPELPSIPIVRPVVTEKSSAAYGARKEYASALHSEATKPQIQGGDRKRCSSSGHRRPHDDHAASGARTAATRAAGRHGKRDRHPQEVRLY